MAIRNLLRSKYFSIINITGLAIGLAAIILIFLYVKFQLSFNNFHNDEDRLFRVSVKASHNGELESDSFIFTPPIGPAMKNDLPEVKNYTRYRTPRPEYFIYDDNPIKVEDVIYADSTFLTMFSFPLVNGNPQNCLTNPNSVVLSASLSEKIFGDINPVGKSIKNNKGELFQVTAVVKDPPPNSDIQFNAIISFETLYSDPGNYMDWNGGNQYITYIELYNASQKKDVEAKLPDFMWKYINKDMAVINISYLPYLQPLNKIHLHFNPDSQNNLNNIYIFSTVAVFLLLIACVNFINLSTSRAKRRSMEIGIRKVLGAEKKSIIGQFLTESLLITLVSTVIALFLVETFFPVFRKLVEERVDFAAFLDLNFFIGLAIIIFVTGVLAGIYPAFVLSSYQPVKAITGKDSFGKTKVFSRNLLVVFQFVISIGLIIITSLINSQMDFIKNKSLGFNKKNVVVLPLNNPELQKNAETIKQELQKIPGVKSSSASSDVPYNGFTSNGYFPEGINTPMMISVVDVDQDFIKTFSLKIVRGRNFIEGSEADNNSYIINESLAKQLGWNDPVGKTITRNGKHPVIGVVKDFHYASLHEKVQPLIITSSPWRNCFSVLSVSLNTPDIFNTINSIKEVWKKFSPSQPFEFHFLDDEINQVYRSEQKFRELFFYYSILSIIVALMGLFGLTTHTVEQRSKEIAIRKVHGATIKNVTTLITAQFVKWVLAANIIACPIAYLFIKNWLEDFAYQTEISWYIFVVSGMFTLLVVLLTVSYQAIKAATTNPVESLRYE